MHCSALRVVCSAAAAPKCRAESDAACSSDVKKDLTFKAKDQDNLDKDCILVLKESLGTRTRTNITGLQSVNSSQTNSLTLPSGHGHGHEYY